MTGPTDPVHGDDIGVLETGGGPRFPQEPLDELLVERHRKRENLECHLPIEHEFPGPIDHRHAPATEFLPNLIIVA